MASDAERVTLLTVSNRVWNVMPPGQAEGAITHFYCMVWTFLSNEIVKIVGNCHSKYATETFLGVYDYYTMPFQLFLHPYFIHMYIIYKCIVYLLDIERKNCHSNKKHLKTQTETLYMKVTNVWR